MKKNQAPKPSAAEAKKQIKGSQTADELFEIGNICQSHKLWGKIIHKAKELNLSSEVISSMEVKKTSSTPLSIRKQIYQMK